MGILFVGCLWNSYRLLQNISCHCVRMSWCIGVSSTLRWMSLSRIHQISVVAFWWTFITQFIDTKIAKYVIQIIRAANTCDGPTHCCKPLRFWDTVYF
jgi:hypothetical protein